MDRLTSMAVFVKTAESGSFAAAALAFRHLVAHGRQHAWACSKRGRARDC